MRDRWGALLALSMLAASGAAHPAPVADLEAGHGCSSKLVIFSGFEPLNSVNANGVVCLAAPDQDLVDGRIINPGSTYVSVRYTRDLGQATKSVKVVVDGPGFGFDRRTVTLNRTRTPTGSWVYDSDRMAIEPTSSGCLNAWLEGTAADHTSYRSVDATCGSLAGLPAV